MLRMILIAIVSLLVSCAASAAAPYLLELQILDRLNEENPDDKYIIQRLSASPHRIATLIGWVKLETLRQPGTPPEKIFLRWIHIDSANREIVLDSGFNVGNEHLEFLWNPNKQTTFYWVTKRIWTDQVGEYKLQLLNKKREYLGEIAIIVED